MSGEDDACRNIGRSVCTGYRNLDYNVSLQGSYMLGKEVRVANISNNTVATNNSDNGTMSPETARYSNGSTRVSEVKLPTTSERLQFDRTHYI